MSELIRRNPERVKERLSKLRSIVNPKKPNRRFPSDFDNEEYLEPAFWTRKFNARVEDVQFVKMILKKAGI